MKRRTKLYYVAFTIALCSFLAANVRAENNSQDAIMLSDGDIEVTGDLMQWHNITLVLGGPSASETASPNPFLDYKLTGIFTKGDQSYTVPGYFDADGNAAETSANSGNVWKVHFCPPETGTWNYTIRFRSGTGIAISDNVEAGVAVTSLDTKTGSFTVIESDKTGNDLRAKGRLQYVGKNHLQFAGNKEWFLKAGSDAPENFLAYEDFDNTPNNGGRRKSWEPHQQDFVVGDPTWQGGKGSEIIGAINYLASKGLNAFSFLSMNINGDDQNVFPYVSSGNFQQFDCSKLDQWEIVFSHAEKMGMYLHFKTQETENEMLLDNGNLGTNRKLYYRELIARFGHHLALNWNLGEENGDYGDTNQSDAQRKAMAKYFMDTDPYKNHVVLHTAPGGYDKIYTPLLGSNSELTGLSMQLQWNDVYNKTKEWVAKSNNAGKPWVVACDEQGGADIGVPEDFYGGTPNRNDIRKETLWGNFMGGGAGVEYYFGYKRPESDLTCQDFRLRDMSWSYCKIALDFFNLYLPFWDMEPMNNLVTNGRCLAKPGEVYVVQLTSGGSTTLDLPAGKKYNVDWFSPENGGALIPSALSPVSGGNNVSLGSAPNTKTDWIALVREENFNHTPNKTVLVDCGGEAVILNAFTDFPETSISGFAPAYKDGGNQCLAIDAAQYKGQYAAAKTTFSGESGYYNIKINTLLEFDGESTYKIKVDGEYVGQYQNVRTGESGDLSPSSHIFEGIAVNNQSVIQVEFNAHTNELIPEGGGTAYSRGRWKSLAFIPLCQGVPPFPSEDEEDVAEAPTWVEENGYVVVDVESNPDYKNKNWEKREGYSHLGSGYLEYIGNDNMGAPSSSSTLVYNIKITTPGSYDFLWHTKQQSNAPSFDAWNDSWLKINADHFYCNGNVANEVQDATKVWTQTQGEPAFVWECRAETHTCGNGVTLHAKFDAPGTYSVEIAGRSKGHIIDRFVLAMAGKMDQAKNQVEESRIIAAGVLEPYKFVELVTTSKTVVRLEEGQEENITASVFPQDATDKTVVWSSSDRDIAIVDNGKIIAVGEGVAAITAAAKENKSIQQIVTVEVSKKELTSVILHDKNIMTVLSADSWDKDFSDIGQIEYAIDDDPDTYWHTRWNQAQDPLPHWIIIDLGKEVPIDEVDYLPRQDQWGPNGAIEKYEIFLTNDTTNWGEAVHKGEFSWGENPSVEDYKAMRTITFENTVHGRYFKLLALTEDQNKPDVPFSCIAELYFRTFFEGVSMSSKSESMRVGTTTNVSLETKPFDDPEKYPVKWVSTNTSVATVNNGLIEAVDSGFTYVIASIFEGEYTDTCLVQVQGNSATTVGIMQNNVRLIPTASYPLMATTQPKGAEVSWSVQNNEVATISTSGLLTAIAEGSTAVYAEIAGGIKDEITVNVVNPGIILNKESDKMISGEVSEISYSAIPADSIITWRSSNAVIATVSNGVVVAKAAGEVNIIAEMMNGTVSESMALTVLKPSVKIAYADTSIILGTQISISAVADPDSCSIVWKSSNNKVATVSESGEIIAISRGIALISASIMDGKFESVCAVTVNNPPTGEEVGVNNVQVNKEVVIFPNPTEGMVYFTGTYAIASLRIYNLQGALIMAKKLNAQRIDISELDKGLYILELVTDNDIFITKRLFKE